MKNIIRRAVYNFIYVFLRATGGKAYASKDFNPFTLIKYFFYQKILRINAHVNWPVHRTSQVKVPENIKRGSRYPAMSMGCYLDGRNGIIFGENVWVGPRVSIISMNHDLYDYTKYVEMNPIEIGDDCWLGTGCIILPGVILGNHVIVAAGAIVTKSFKESNIVIGGNPAKIIKHL
jgi:acetyltransferase-like isoleucine patch superfamily enzyme